MHRFNSDVCVCVKWFTRVWEMDKINSLSLWLAKQTIRIGTLGAVCHAEQSGELTGPGDDKQWKKSDCQFCLTAYMLLKEIDKFSIWLVIFATLEVKSSVHTDQF